MIFDRLFQLMAEREASDIYVTAGAPIHIKINGAVKTWKRDTSRVEVPLKYGLYEMFRDSARSDGTMHYLIVDCDKDGELAAY